MSLRIARLTAQWISNTIDDTIDVRNELKCDWGDCAVDKALSLHISKKAYIWSPEPMFFKSTVTVTSELGNQRQACSGSPGCLLVSTLQQAAGQEETTFLKNKVKPGVGGARL